MKEEKKNWHSIYLILIGFLICIMTLPYLRYLNLLPEQIAKSKFYENLCTGFYFLVFKAFYVAMVPFLTSLLFSIKIATTLKESSQKSYQYYYWIISVFILIGTINSPVFHYYNILFLPLILLLSIYIASRGFSKIAVELKDENNFVGFNKAPKEIMGLTYNVIDKNGRPETLNVNNVFQGILVCGGAGAGKSASWIDPAIFQWAQLGCSMTIYDFKGKPATLGLSAYNSWNHMKSHPEKFEQLNRERALKNQRPLKIPTYELVTFDDLSKSSRPNPISPKNITSSLDSKSIMMVFLKGLNKGFVKNEDFWAGAAFSLAHGLAERLRKSYPEYCTIPHLIILGLQPPILLMEWLKQDFEVDKIISSFTTAIMNNAEGQIAGMISSFQQPLTVLLEPSIFWVLGAPYHEQSDLNLNDIDNPRIVSFSNDPKKRQALSPIISCLLESVMSNINEQNKHPHAFIIDEYPTLYLDISNLPATGRSNQISTLVSFQDASQSESEYGKAATDKLISNLGTQAFGMTNLASNAKAVSDMFGQAKVVDKSYSISDDGITQSTRLSNETTIQTSHVINQPKGHFTGKVADGDPAFFQCQFAYFNIKEEVKTKWTDEVDILNYPPTIMAAHHKYPDIAKQMFETLVEAHYQQIITESLSILSGGIQPTA